MTTIIGLQSDARELVGFEAKELFRQVNFLKIRKSDVEYLERRYAFLQMANLKERANKLTDPQVISASSGWKIHDYGDVLSTSPGEYLFNGVLGKGTIVQQIVDTASEMVALAKQRRWPLISIVDGEPLMQWAAWMAAQDDGVDLEGYEPSQEGREKRSRVLHYLKVRQKIYRGNPVDKTVLPR